MDAEALFLSAITVLELETGVRLIDRRGAAQGTVLRRWIDSKVLPAFAGRILPVDTVVAQRCAALHVLNPRAERDALVAATALVHRLKVGAVPADFYRSHCATPPRVPHAVALL